METDFLLSYPKTDNRLRYFKLEELEYRDRIADQMRELGLTSQASRFQGCASKYILLWCQNEDRNLAFPMRCEQRICGRCVRCQAKKLRERIEAMLKTVSPMAGRRLMFLTLTKQYSIGHRPEPLELKALFAAARKLINRLYPKQDGCGAVGVLEVGSNFNFHIHCVVYGCYIEQRMLSDTWFKLTGDSPVVDIRLVRDLRRAVNYLLGYITKPPRFGTAEDYAYYARAIKGVRRVHTYGIFYGFKLGRMPFRCPACGGDLMYYQIVYHLDTVNNCVLASELFRILKGQEN